MAVSLDTVYSDAMSLSEDAKEELVERLMADLVARPDPELDAIHVRNARRRRDAMRSGAVQPIPGADVLRRAREMLET